MPKVIVVGAGKASLSLSVLLSISNTSPGWFGLIAAQTYLAVHPTHTLILLESKSTLGGTWSRTRVYRGMITHNGIGALEISSHPLRNGSPTAENYIRGDDVAEYLHTLAEKYDLYQRIRYNSPVTAISRDLLTREWLVNVLKADGSVEEERCEKLIMATGMTSTPFTPTDIPITDPAMELIHCGDLGARQDFLEGPTVNHVTIYGGSKSAFDAAYMCAAAGKKVDWVARTTGQGVAAMFTAQSFGTASALLAPKRFFNALSPCIYNRTTLVSWLLHGTAFGRGLIRFYWRTFTKILWKKHGLHTSANGRKLIPDLGDLGPFWSGSTPTGVISQPDFWSYVHPATAPITVHRAEITSISGTTVTLSNGLKLTPDAHIWGTGWIRNSSPLGISEPSLALDAGVPVHLSLVPGPTAEHWEHLETAADALVLSTFPLLSEPPPYRVIPRTHTPYRLYRLIAPPAMAARGDNSLIFVGMLHTSATGMMAELQALWGVAYLDGKLDLRERGANGIETRRAMEVEVAEAGMWSRRRYLNLGEKSANLTFEFIPVCLPRSAPLPSPIFQQKRKRLIGGET